MSTTFRKQVRLWKSISITCTGSRCEVAMVAATVNWPTGKQGDLASDFFQEPFIPSLLQRVA